METQLAILKTFLRAEETLSNEEWEEFAKIWEPYSVGRKEIITFSGQRENYLYFVLGGVQRIYRILENDKEATLIFSYPHSYSGVMDSFLLQQSSNYHFESLTPSVFLRTSHASFLAVTEKYPQIDRLIKNATYHALAGLLERMTELQCYSSEEKFKILLKRSPQLLQLVPHKYLANYLGIDATNFSKLINRVKI